MSPRQRLLFEISDLKQQYEDLLSESLDPENDNLNKLEQAIQQKYEKLANVSLLDKILNIVCDVVSIVFFVGFAGCMVTMLYYLLW